MKSLINDEDNSENDILTKSKNKEINNSVYKGKKDIEEKLYKKNLNNFITKENKNISNGKIIYNYTMNNFDLTNKSQSINNSDKNVLDTNKPSLYIKNKNNKEIFNYNEKQINKSNSYFLENNYRNNKNKYYFMDLNKHNENKISSLNNITNDNNYKKNENIFDQNNKIFDFLNPSSKKSSNHRIYIGKDFNEKKYSDKDSSESNSFESFNIDEIINKVNYEGDKKNFPQYIEELKLKADITSMIQNMFKNEINGYDKLDKFMKNYSKNKNKKILNMYKYVLNRLIQENQNMINDKEINSFFEEIYSIP